jgi:hypothetical protein
MPVITYFAAKKWPRSSIRYLHWPVIFSGNGLIPPATVYIYLCCKSQYYISILKCTLTFVRGRCRHVLQWIPQAQVQRMVGKIREFSMKTKY